MDERKSLDCSTDPSFVGNIAALRTFAAHIAAADTASGVIEIPREDRHIVLPPMLRESMYIRESYLEVLRKLDALGNDFALVLSNSPGIGKSAFAVLLLHHLAKQRAKVAYRCVTDRLWPTFLLMALGFIEHTERRLHGFLCLLRGALLVCWQPQQGKV